MMGGARLSCRVPPRRLAGSGSATSRAPLQDGPPDGEFAMIQRNAAAWALAASLWLGLSMGLSGCTSTPTQQPAGEAIEDGVVTAKVKAALVQDPITKAHHINVETFKGQVQLSGYVENDEARTRALQVARDVAGVRKVTDAMQVRIPQG